MQTKLKNLASFLAVGFVLTGSLFAQAVMPFTSLTAAIPDFKTSAISVASATNITIPQTPFPQGGIGDPSGNVITVLLVDTEAMLVNGLSGTTIYVERGYNGTIATSHANSANVWVGPASYFAPYQPSGSCVTNSIRVLPRVVIAAPSSVGGTGGTGSIWQCSGVGSATGNWFSYQTYTTRPVISAAIASATTIAPIATVFHVTGTTAIVNITVPLGFPSGACMTIIPDGIFTTTNAGNIAIASTAVVSKTLLECYDAGTSKFYPSY